MKRVDGSEADLGLIRRWAWTALNGGEKADGPKPLDTGALSGHIWPSTVQGYWVGPNMSGPGRSCQHQMTTGS